MNVQQLIAQFRRVVDDKVTPYLWDDEEVLLYLNEAQMEVARRSRCFTDSLDPELCHIPVTLGVSTYKLDERILYIKRIRSDLHSGQILPIKSNILDRQDINWETNQGRVTHYVTDVNSRSITLYKVPNANQNLSLTVVRLPIEELNDLSDIPEISKEYHIGMLNFVYFMAYSKQDPETKSEEKASNFYNLFEAEFGTKKNSSALQEEFENENATIFNDGRF